MSAAQNTKGVLAVRLGRAGIITLLAAAALSLYALAGIAGAGAEIERNSRTREAFDAAVYKLDEECAALEALLSAGRKDRAAIAERLAGERLGLVSPGG